VGTGVTLVVRLHQALKFRNEDNGVEANGTLKR
jgi:hypothetical protein